MNNLPLQPLKWFDGGDCYGNLEAHSPSHYYVITEEDEKQKVMYGKHYHISKEATGFATIDEAKAWAWRHYNEKMQPYVKPMPTWIDVNERLPEEDGLYLAYYPDQLHKQQIVFFSLNINKFNYFHDLVTHWQPLPNPPEGE